MTNRVRREFEELYGSHTPESYRNRLWEWFREDYTDEFGAPDPNRQPRRNADELAARRIGDAERIACTLLAKTDVAHPIARWWIERIINDPAFAQRLDEFCRQSPDEWLALLKPESPDRDPRGLHVHTSGDVARLFIELGQQGYALSEIWNAIVDMQAHPEDTPLDIRRIDRAAVLLATDVVEHRLYHEPDTNHTLTVQGVYTVTTSLAARVVEFHQAVADAYAADARRRGR